MKLGILLLSGAVLAPILYSCGPATPELPEAPVDRAATCGIVAAAAGRARTKDVSAPLPLTGQPTAQLIPGAELKVYDGAPHGIFVTHLERVNQDLLRFIRS